MRDAVRQRRPVDQLHDEGLHAVGIFESVDVRDVRMIQRRQNFAPRAGSGRADRDRRHSAAGEL